LPRFTGLKIFFKEFSMKTKDKVSVLGSIFLILLATCGMLTCKGASGSTDSGGAQPAEKVETPSASPGGGIYTETQTVELTTSPLDAEIWYTLDGSAPAQNGESSTLYAQPIQVDMGQSLKALGIKTGMANSDILTAIYTQDGTVAIPEALPPAGAYTTAQDVSLSTSTHGAEIYYTLDGSDPESSISRIRYLDGETFRVELGTTLRAIAEKEDMTSSSVVSFAYTRLTDGSPAGGPAGDPAADSVASPTASLAAGTYLVTVDEPSQSVELLSDESDATIRYTTNGTAPDENSAEYISPITISETTALRAVVFVPGKSPSSELSCLYTMKVAQPVVATGDEGTFTAAQLLKLADVAPGVTLRYGISGSTITESPSSTQKSSITIRTTSGSGSPSAPEHSGDGNAYDTTKGISIDVDNTVVKVIAFKDGCMPSDELSLTYRINKVTGISDISPQNWAFTGFVATTTTKQFSAIVSQTGSPEVTVVWSSSPGVPGTTIGASSGLFTKGPNEIVSITVTASISNYSVKTTCTANYNN
jgi:hypothetical protein